MTESGFDMPPDHMVFQMRSTLDFSAPVIMTSPSPVTVGPRTARTSRGDPSRDMPLADSVRSDGSFVHYCTKPDLCAGLDGEPSPAGLGWRRQPVAGEPSEATSAWLVAGRGVRLQPYVTVATAIRFEPGRLPGWECARWRPVACGLPLGALFPFPVAREANAPPAVAYFGLSARAG